MAAALRNRRHAVNQSQEASFICDLAHDFLPKPFPLRLLAGKIREVLEQPALARAAGAGGSV